MNRAALMQRIEQHFGAKAVTRATDLAVLLEDICCQVHQWARADALAELHPAWLAEKERADRAEAAAKADAERLDFLDLNSDYGMGWRVGVAPAGCVSAHVVIGDRASIREAIDAARCAAGAMAAPSTGEAQ